MRKVNVDGNVGKALGVEPGEYELHEVAKGVVVLSYVGKASDGKLTEEELKVLQKLTSFRFEKRIPYTVNKTLSDDEKKTLEELIKRGVVELYKEGKYKRTGVYNIPKKVYPRIRKSDGRRPLPQTPPENMRGIERLEKYGYAVIVRENEARDISRAFEKQIKAGDYMGVRGFNKRFYIANKMFYINVSESIRRVLAKKDSRVGEIAAELKIPEDACTVVLTLMNNDSEVIEKKKGLYTLV